MTMRAFYAEVGVFQVIAECAASCWRAQHSPAGNAVGIDSAAGQAQSSELSWDLPADSNAHHQCMAHIMRTIAEQDQPHIPLQP